MRGIQLAALIALLGCAPSTPYLNRALSDAKQRQKPLVVEFYATWCEPCRMFEEIVLPDPRVQQALRDVHFVRYDVERPAGRDAFARCRGRGLPMVAAIDGEGIVRLVKRGERGDAGELLEFLRETQAVLGAPPP